MIHIMDNDNTQHRGMTAGTPAERTLAGLLSRYTISTAGLLMVALGIALSIISNLGTAPLSCPAYLLSLRWKPSVGTFTIIVNTSLILIQLLAIRSRFKLKYLMQIPASLVFGYMIDFWIWALPGLVPVTLASRLALVLAGCVITALGVSLEVTAQAWMLSAEMTVYVFTKVIPKPFGTLKVWMDCLFVVFAAVISFLLFSNPFGSGAFTSLPDTLLARSQGVVIGLGTLLCAVLPGFLMRWSNPLADRLFKLLHTRDTDRKWRRTMENDPEA